MKMYFQTVFVSGTKLYKPQVHHVSPKQINTQLTIGASLIHKYIVIYALVRLVCVLTGDCKQTVLYRTRELDLT